MQRSKNLNIKNHTQKHLLGILLCLSLMPCFCLTACSSKKQLGFKAQAGWIQEKPNNNMRAAQFRLPGKEEGSDAELAVFYFPEQAGMNEANLNRWYKKFKHKNGKAIDPNAVSKMEIKFDGITVTSIYLEGTYSKKLAPMLVNSQIKEMPGYAMLAAIAEAPAGPWFFRMIGPKETVEKWQNSFDALINSFHLE